MSTAHVDPALVLRRRAVRRSEARRRLAVLVGFVAILLLPLGYWGLQHSSVFSISRVAVTGGTPRVDALVRAAAAGDVAGKSLLQVDSSLLAARLEAIPDVRVANVDRAFPHTVAVSVVMEQPAAVVRTGRTRVIVSSDGRVLRAAVHPAKTLPRVVLPTATLPAPGRTVEGTPMRAALLVLTSVPAGFERDVARLKGVVAGSGGVVAVFGHGLQVRLGDTDRLALKLRVAARVLSKMGAPIRRSVAYVDVSAPARPAVGYRK
jgi:cell division protein FtsQ